MFPIGTSKPGGIPVIGVSQRGVGWAYIQGCMAYTQG